MRVLLIDDDPLSLQTLLDLMAQKRIRNISPIPSMQEGIETLESQADTIAMVICNYRGGSSALLRLLLQVSSKIPAIVFADPKIKLESASLMPHEARLSFLERSDYSWFLTLLDQYCEEGVLESRLISDSSFVRLSTENIQLDRPLTVDIYIRLAPDRYCRRFKQADQIDGADLERYSKNPNMKFVYVKREELDGWLSDQGLDLDTLLNQEEVTHEQAQQVAQEKLEIVHNVVSQLGFTAKAEELSKKAVAVTLRAIGNSPQLSDILRKIQLQDGKYIASHSLMLAEIACSLAHKLTWSSAPTFLKLTTAALMHDLSLPSNKLARMKTLSELTEANGFTKAELQAFKMHPVQGAEYARQLKQLPPDVDTIILQHHEQPDGRGFPRGLYHHQISPLASVLIVAEDLLNFFLENGSNTKGDLFAAFQAARESKYSAGNFKKVLESLTAPDNAP